MIDDFKNKKLVEYLEPGKKVLIRFGHGLGDTIMFMPILEQLRRDYDNHFEIYLESGQEQIFKTELDKEGKDYDLVFSLDFPMSEGSELTKAEKCCREEIGIEPDFKEFAVLDKYESPFVAVHFQGTSLPGSVNCSEEVANQIWEEVKRAGKIPIECHFEHIFHNPVNNKFEFINRDVRDIEPDLKKLIGLIQHSYAFIGVASGPLCVALSVMPDKTLYLEKEHKIKNYIHKQISQVDIKNYQSGEVEKWLNTLQ